MSETHKESAPQKVPPPKEGQIDEKMISEPQGESSPEEKSRFFSKQQLLEKLREANEPFETKVSPELVTYLESCISKFTERGFLLFAKNGVVCKAVESTAWCNPKSISFTIRRTSEVLQAMEAEGYDYVGTYHHHPESDEEIEHRQQPGSGYPYPNYDPVHLSTGDIGIFNKLAVWQDGNGWKKPKSDEKYLFIGHKSEKRGYRLRCYTVLSELPEGHPWKTHAADLRKFGFNLRHYRDIDGILDHPVEHAQGTADNDPTASQILEKHDVAERIFERDFQNEIFGSGRIRVFTESGELTMVELYFADGKTMKRYGFNDGELDRIIIYGDNRRSKTQQQRIPLDDDKTKAEEWNKLNNSFGTMFKDLKGK